MLRNDLRTLYSDGHPTEQAAAHLKIYLITEAPACPTFLTVVPALLQ